MQRLPPILLLPTNVDVHPNTVGKRQPCAGSTRYNVCMTRPSDDTRAYTAAPCETAANMTCSSPQLFHPMVTYVYLGLPHQADRSFTDFMLSDDFNVQQQHGYVAHCLVPEQYVWCSFSYC